MCGAVLPATASGPFGVQSKFPWLPTRNRVMKSHAEGSKERRKHVESIPAMNQSLEFLKFTLPSSVNGTKSSNGVLGASILARSSSRHIRIRVPDFFSVVYFGRGTQNPKRVGKSWHLAGPSSGQVDMSGGLSSFRMAAPSEGRGSGPLQLGIPKQELRPSKLHLVRKQGRKNGGCPFD